MSDDPVTETEAKGLTNNMQAIITHQHELQAFHKTDAGGKMNRFESAVATVWQNDHRDDLSYKRQREMGDAMDLARIELRDAIKTLQADNERLHAELAASAETLEMVDAAIKYWCDGSMNQIIQSDLLNRAARYAAAAKRAREAGR